MPCRLVVSNTTPEAVTTVLAMTAITDVTKIDTSNLFSTPETVDMVLVDISQSEVVLKTAASISGPGLGVAALGRFMRFLTEPGRSKQ